MIEWRYFVVCTLAVNFSKLPKHESVHAISPSAICLYNE
jgi:hypothetical protein